MRISIVATCLLLSGVALADDHELALAPIPARATAPSLALGSEATCPQDPALITTRTLAVGRATVAIGHDCGQMDESTRLWIRTPAGAWFEGRDVNYQYEGAHMTDAPGFRHLVDESLTTGTLADGQLAVVHHIAIEDGTRCWKASHCPSGIETSRVVNLVEVCRVDTPACERVELACPAKGCGAIALRRGTLTVAAAKASFRVR